MLRYSNTSNDGAKIQEYEYLWAKYTRMPVIMVLRYSNTSNDGAKIQDYEYLWAKYTRMSVNDAKIQEYR